MTLTFSGASFQTLRLQRPESPSDLRRRRHKAPQHHTGNADGFNTARGLGSSRFARRYCGNRCYFLFLQVLRWFNSLSSLLKSYEFAPEAIPSTGIGFSHSEIFGSELACSSPKLIAAGHVFRWSLAPRHPPCALYNLFLLALDHNFFKLRPANLPDHCKKTFCWMFFHRILFSISSHLSGAPRLSEVIILANL